eukprot:TRINITY_DN66629_c1_g6_i1.p1 TRINITY_DN66629_c1_g6~~TRINITY_DN66629_c1_g6_i1.p1  ORF type:complete len:1012 (-),score=136.81 TRINITY_DN66629_c1_g6_i1:112-3147(-)
MADMGSALVPGGGALGFRGNMFGGGMGGPGSMFGGSRHPLEAYDLAMGGRGNNMGYGAGTGPGMYGGAGGVHPMHGGRGGEGMDNARMHQMLGGPQNYLAAAFGGPGANRFTPYGFPHGGPENPAAQQNQGNATQQGQQAQQEAQPSNSAAAVAGAAGGFGAPPGVPRQMRSASVPRSATFAGRGGYGMEQPAPPAAAPHPQPDDRMTPRRGMLESTAAATLAEPVKPGTAPATTNQTPGLPTGHITPAAMGGIRPINLGYGGTATPVGNSGLAATPLGYPHSQPATGASTPVAGAMLQADLHGTPRRPADTAALGGVGAGTPFAMGASPSAQRSVSVASPANVGGPGGSATPSGNPPIMTAGLSGLSTGTYVIPGQGGPAIPGLVDTPQPQQPPVPVAPPQAIPNSARSEPSSSMLPANLANLGAALATPPRASFGSATLGASMARIGPDGKSVESSPVPPPIRADAQTPPAPTTASAPPPSGTAPVVEGVKLPEDFRLPPPPPNRGESGVASPTAQSATSPPATGSSATGSTTPAAATLNSSRGPAPAPLGNGSVSPPATGLGSSAGLGGLSSAPAAPPQQPGAMSPLRASLDKSSASPPPVTMATLGQPATATGALHYQQQSTSMFNTAMPNSPGRLTATPPQTNTGLATPSASALRAMATNTMSSAAATSPPSSAFGVGGLSSPTASKLSSLPSSTSTGASPAHPPASKIPTSSMVERAANYHALHNTPVPPPRFPPMELAPIPRLGSAEDRPIPQASPPPGPLTTSSLRPDLGRPIPPLSGSVSPLQQQAPVRHLSPLAASHVNREKPFLPGEAHPAPPAPAPPSQQYHTSAPAAPLCQPGGGGSAAPITRPMPNTPPNVSLSLASSPASPLGDPTATATVSGGPPTQSSATITSSRDTKISTGPAASSTSTSLATASPRPATVPTTPPQPTKPSQSTPTTSPPATVSAPQSPANNAPTSPGTGPKRGAGRPIGGTATSAFYPPGSRNDSSGKRASGGPGWFPNSP